MKGASWKMHTSLTLTSHYPGFSHMTIPRHKGGWVILSVPRDHMLRKNGKADKGRKNIHSTISTICHRKTNEDVYYWVTSPLSLASHQPQANSTGVTAPLSIRVSSTLLSCKVQCVVTSCLFTCLFLQIHLGAGQLLGLHLSLWSPWPNPHKTQVGVQNLYNYQNSLHLHMHCRSQAVSRWGLDTVGCIFLMSKNIFVCGNNTFDDSNIETLTKVYIEVSSVMSSINSLHFVPQSNHFY